MSDSEVIDKLGGTNKVAKMLDVQPPSVSAWRHKGIPRARKHTLSLMFPNSTPRDWRPADEEKLPSAPPAH